MSDDSKIPEFIDGVFHRMNDVPENESVWPFSLSEFSFEGKTKEYNQEFHYFMMRKLNDAAQKALKEFCDCHEDLTLEEIKNGFRRMEMWQWQICGIVNPEDANVDDPSE